jgi:uncharacterized protein
MDRTEILDKLLLYKKSHQQDYLLTKIGVFGSFAKKNETPGSDVDVVVELQNPDLFILGSIKTELEQLFGRKVDIVRLRENMNPFLKKRILKESIYV